jgi:hypothetical protein
MKILRPQKVGAEAGLGDELNADFFALGAHGVLFAIKYQKAQFRCSLQKLRRLQAQLLPNLGRRQLVACAGAICGLLVVLSGGFGGAADSLQWNTHLFTDADDALGFFVGVFVELAVFTALDQDAHLVVVHLAELIQVQTGDDAHLFIHVALGMQVFAEAGADVGEAAKPLNLLRLQLAFAVNDAHVDLEPVLVRQQFLHAVIELEKWADQYEAVGCALDHFLKEIVGRAGV